jgi:nucleoside-diphosphate-sugar epimerase
MYRNTIRWTRITRNVLKILHIRQPRTVEYGWQKLFSERLYLAFTRNYGIDIRIARFHNVFGRRLLERWSGKAPAAFCRKIAQAPDGGN